MFFNISFDDPAIGVLAQTNLSNFSFSSSLYKLNNTAQVKITDITRLLFNKIKIGSQATITFYDANSKEEYINKMSVLSFTKDVSVGMADIISITFISSQYFKDEVSTQAHSGTVSQILYNICSKSFQYNLNWSDSDDIVRYRYQIAERYQDFMLRMLKYGVIKETPVFLYSDARGKLNFKGEYDLRKETPKYYLTLGLTDNVKQKFDISKTMIEIIVDNFTANSCSSKTSSSITSKFTTTLFKSPSVFLSEKTSINIEDKNAQTESLHEYTKDNGVKSFYASPTRTDFYGWELAPTDALAIAVRNNYNEIYNRYTLNISITSIAPDIFIPGTTVWVVLPFKPTEKSSTGVSVNCSEGIYIVQSVVYTYTNNKFNTRMVLSQIAY